MGIILGKLRKKKSTYEVLEKLDAEIKYIEEFRRNTEQTHKKIVGRFILISVFVYLITAFIFYFYFFPASMYERLIYIIPLLFAPVIILSVKKVLTWYYNRKIKKNQSKLSNLREEKKKMLEKVMETETYKVAKSILEKFAPEQVRKPATYNETSTPLKPATPSISTSIVPLQSGATGLRYRGTGAPNTELVRRQTYAGPTSTPILTRPALPPPMPSSTISRPSQGMLQPPGRLSAMVPSGTPLRLPREILPRERSALDKMVDYLVGDGPSNRYALICSQCASHNGMALKEEFEYLSFRCCYCSTFNPARKKRPAAPKLETDLKTPPLRQLKNVSESQDSSSDSESDSGTERGDKLPIVTLKTDSESESVQSVESATPVIVQQSDDDKTPLQSKGQLLDDTLKAQQMSGQSHHLEGDSSVLRPAAETLEVDTLDVQSQETSVRKEAEPSEETVVMPNKQESYPADLDPFAVSTAGIENVCYPMDVDPFVEPTPVGTEEVIETVETENEEKKSKVTGSGLVEEILEKQT